MARYKTNGEIVTVPNKVKDAIVLQEYLLHFMALLEMYSCHDELAHMLIQGNKAEPDVWSKEGAEFMQHAIEYVQKNKTD